jgi:hypothetical protein
MVILLYLLVSGLDFADQTVLATARPARPQFMSIHRNYSESLSKSTVYGFVPPTGTIDGY